MQVASREPTAPPENLAPLGRIQIIRRFDDTTFRVQLPPVRGHATRDAFHRGLKAAQLPPLKIPQGGGDMGSALVLAGVAATYGTIQASAAILTPVKAAWKGLSVSGKGIPGFQYYPAMRALTSAQSHYRPTEEVIQRILAAAPPPGLPRIQFVTNSESATADTLLELYDGERSLRGDPGSDRRVPFRFNFKCSLFRAHDGALLHVFRVAYTSESRLFSQWGANDAALFHEAVETGMARVTEQIVAHLSALDAHPNYVPPSFETQPARVRYAPIPIASQPQP